MALFDPFFRRLIAPAIELPLLKARQFTRRRRTRNQHAIRARCCSHYLGDHQALCWVLGRYRMFVDTRDVGFSTHMLMDGYWEMWLTEALVERLKRGMSFVDCGANLGYYSVLAADLVRAEGQVHAFEPNPRMTELLRRTLAVNGYHDRVAVHEIALSDRAGELLMRVPEGEPKNAHSIDAEAAAGDPDVLRVPALRLDAVLGDAPVDVIKIDVEGSEEALWKGMTGLLNRRAPLTVFLEFASDRYDRPGDFLDNLMRFGFRLELLTLGRGIVPVSREDVLAAPGNIDQMLVLTR